MMLNYSLPFLLFALFLSCSSSAHDALDFPDEFIATSFNAPVGLTNGVAYYNAQKFGENHHLGEDWNSVTGGDTDLGDPIHAIANGYVAYSTDNSGGWGNSIRVIHELPNGQRIESLYAHCDERFVSLGDWAEAGEVIGTANGRYLAHLHFEIHDVIGLPIGPGYSQDTSGYLNPSAFLEEQMKN